MLTLESLAESGALIDQAPQKKLIKWTSMETGEDLEGEIWVRPMAYGEAEALVLGKQQGKSDARIIVVECVRLGEGAEERLSYDGLSNYDPRLVEAMAAACYEVNGWGSKKKRSPKRKNSGTN